MILWNERLRELVGDTRVMGGYACETGDYLLVSKINLGQG